MGDVEESLQSFVLSATEVSDLTSWPSVMVEDYLNIIRNLVTISTATDAAISQVAINTASIIINTDGIAANTIAINSHINADSAHGSAGDIVGNLDLATQTIAGVVRQSGTVSNSGGTPVFPVTNPDATAAPAAYNQAQMASVVALLNEIKADVNNMSLDVAVDAALLNILLGGLRLGGVIKT